jgi:hypothetical protein
MFTEIIVKSKKYNDAYLLTSKASILQVMHSNREGDEDEVNIFMELAGDWVRKVLCFDTVEQAKIAYEEIKKYLVEDAYSFESEFFTII